MTDEELRAYNQNRKIHQIGIVVKDLDEAVEAWRTLYRVGPWTLLDFNSDNVKDVPMDGVSAKPDFHFRVAAAMIGETQIELIEANESMPLYQEFLDRTGGGIHHFKEKVPDAQMDAMRAYYADQGMGTMFGGLYRNLSFYYVDTADKLGFQLELGNCEKLKP